MLRHGEWRVASATYVVASLGLPQLDVLGGQSLDVASVVNNTGTSRACTDIDTDVMVLRKESQSRFAVRHQ